ncbi:MAG: DUF4325 domain-containing protein [Stagnimonas sp.]|nr:DUF4325 domain-containing protein [Stagnimonas sp.]
MARSAFPKLDDTILRLLPDHPKDLVSAVAAKMGASRPTVSTAIRRLEALGLLQSEGTTRKIYSPTTFKWHGRIDSALDESLVWQKHFSAQLAKLPENQRDILHYGLTEMLNNVRDHSEGKRADIMLSMRPDAVAFSIADDGEGIFRRIARLQKLPDEKLALLELAKGKLTTDPKNHSGEGIFFSSRVFDEFTIYSSELLFTHDETQDALHDAELPEPLKKNDKGTVVSMLLARESKRTLRDVFDRYAAPAEFTFSKTLVPLRLARLGNENLLSRSQAKRALARVDQFKVVVFDFTEVPLIGQGFADEIFRVFANAHPDIELIPAHFNDEVRRMLLHVGVTQKQLQTKTELT